MTRLYWLVALVAFLDPTSVEGSRLQVLQFFPVAQERQEGRDVGESREAPGSNPTPDTTFQIPPNLVVDIRLFEARAESFNEALMDELSFFIQSDGRGVTAAQWTSTIAKKVPDSFLAALMYETAPVEEQTSRVEWSNDSRKIVTEIELDRFHPAGIFQANVTTRLLRGSRTLSEVSRELNLQIRRTTVWSANELQLSPSDYLSTFREYTDREHRGAMYERLRFDRFYLVMAVTPRVLTEEEIALGPPHTFDVPPDVELPPLVSPLGVALEGTIELGFVLSPGGNPVNPQILGSTLPEANLWLVEEATHWDFTPSDGDSEPRRGRVEVELHLDAAAPTESNSR